MVLFDKHNIVQELTEPVADKIIFSSIHKQLDSILKESRNASFKIPHPVHQHGLINCRATGYKAYVPNTKRIPNWFQVQKFLQVREVIAEAPLTFLSDIIVLWGEQINDSQL